MNKKILKEYRENLPAFQEAAERFYTEIKEALDKNGILVAGIEHRVKKEASLEGKLELKGSKYGTLADITDIIGLRIITFYTDDVDKVATVIERLYRIDWENSVDKRKAHDTDSFGYLSLHYICSAPDFPYRFEIQMRTVLQHAWANMNHDTGYKSGVEVPRHYLRNLSRLAGMLELVDEQFSLIRNELADYRRRVQALVASGNLDEVPLDGDTFRSYLGLDPFGELNRRIASVNQAEIQDVPLTPFLPIFKGMGCQTLGDVDRMVKENAEGAYQIACYQIGLTDLDILSSSIGPQDLCIAYILKQGGGRAGIRFLFDNLNGESPANDISAEFLVSELSGLPFLNQ